MISPSMSVKSDLSSPTGAMGMDPTAPITEKAAGPPPKAGFVRKSRSREVEPRPFEKGAPGA